MDITDSEYREYVQTIKIFLKISGSENRLIKRKKFFFFTVIHFRRLYIYSASNLFDHFDLFFRRYEINILISDIDKFRQKNRNLD
jgi:hypothetical protein